MIIFVHVHTKKENRDRFDRVTEYDRENHHKCQNKKEDLVILDISEMIVP